MATVVCQGLQSLIVEPRTTLRLKLTSPMTHYSQPLDILALKSRFSDINTERSNFKEDCLINKKPNNLNNWSFLQALSNISQSPKVEKENTYVHPLDKCSKCCLSEKSLKLCTENLGNETGTDIIETTIFSMSSCSSMESISKEVMNDKQKQRKVLLGARKAKPMNNFPPPLTTIRGMDCLQVKSHRENGRLVMKAIKNPSKPSAFHVERSHGRLRLTLLEKSTSVFDSENGGDKVDNNESKEFEVDPIRIEEEQKEEEEEEEEGDENDKSDLEEQESKEGKRDECLDEDVDEFVGGKMGMKIFEMPRRCKEGGDNESKTMFNWEPFWVGST